jgi:uncharacterized protein YdaU (DUF1376 family)
MNYYEHHIGDYAEATSHLSFVEDAAYSRLIRKYYATEKPFPADMKTVQRLVGARTKEEREAVQTVLDEFFELKEDGWHNRRCDEEIARYREKDIEREQKSQHEKERMQRHRAERSRVFAELREFGILPKWDTPLAELKAILQREQERTCNAPATRTGTEQERTCNAPATATQTPDTSSLLPLSEHTPSEVVYPPTPQKPPNVCVSEGVPEGVPDAAPKAGEVCGAIRRQGIADGNPGHALFLALLAAGATEAEFVGAAQEARAKGKGFAYILGIVKARRQEVDGLTLRQGAPPPTAKTRDEERREVIDVLTGRNRKNEQERDITGECRQVD